MNVKKMSIAMFFGMFLSVALIQAASLAPLSAYQISHLYMLIQQEGIALSASERPNAEHLASFGCGPVTGPASSPESVAAAARLDWKAALACARKVRRAQKDIQIARDAVILALCKDYGDIHRAYNTANAERIRAQTGGVSIEQATLAVQEFYKFVEARKQEIVKQYEKIMGLRDEYPVEI